MFKGEQRKCKMHHSRKLFLLLLCQCVALKGAAKASPNVILILADDLGYGDLQAGGHPTSETPNINKLLKHGKALTDFHVTSPVCSPSRSSLLTGLYQVTTGIYPGVFWPSDIGGLSQEHPTIATLLSSHNYSTAHIGKWHLGVGAGGRHLPVHHGFQQYLGIPYSQDMCPCKVCFPSTGSNNQSCLRRCNDGDVSCPLYDGDKIIQQPVDLTTLTEKYTKKAVEFIEGNDDNPFFLYMAYQHTHKPQFAGKRFYNSTSRGPFGDSLAEMDDSIGQIISAVESQGQLNNTLIFFTSDNGPSLSQHERGGCAGPLRCGKGTTYEGGTRVPTFVYWKDVIKSGYTSQMMTALDVLPTIAAMINHTDVLETHGFDFSSLLFNENVSEEEETKPIRNSFLHFPTGPQKKIGPYSVRYKNYKAHFYTQGSQLSDNDNYDHACRATSKFTRHDPPLLFNLDSDPGERYSLSHLPEYDSILERIRGEKRKLESEVKWGTSEMSRGQSPHVAPCCNRKKLCSPYPKCCDCEIMSVEKENHVEIQLF